MKIKGKSIVVMILITLLLASVIFGAWFKYIYEPEKRWEEHKKPYDMIRLDNIKWSEISIMMHNNYTEDVIIMSLFYNITTAYPFLDAQGRLLLNAMSVLMNNISEENFIKTKAQHQICVLLDNSVVENRTKYFERLKQNYTVDIYYESFEDVIDYNGQRASLYLHHNYYEKNENYYLLDWTTDFNKIGNQLDFIRGIVNEVEI